MTPRTSLLRNGSILLFLALFGCAPRFATFKDISRTSESFLQYRFTPDGNAAIGGPEVRLGEILYERSLNGGISAQPVGNERMVVIPTFNRRIYFLDPATGKELTSLVTASAITTTPAIKGELLYYTEKSGSDRLSCFNLVNGKHAWSFRIADPQGAPIISDDDLFIASGNGVLYRLNRWRGTVEWEYDAGVAIYAAPSVDSEQVYFGTSTGELICVSQSTGDLVWSHATGGTIFAQPLVAGLVFVGSSDGHLYAIDPATGTMVWRFESKLPIRTTPVRLADQVVFGGDDRNIYSLDAISGRLQWQVTTNAPVQSSPIAVGNTFIVGNNAGTVIQVQRDGSVTGELHVKGSVRAVPAFIDNKVFVATSLRRLIAISLLTP